MALRDHTSDAVHWYMQELSSRVVAETGIPSDRHHLGKLILRGLKDDPEFILMVNINFYCFFCFLFNEITLYPAYCRVDRRNLVLRNCFLLSVQFLRHYVLGSVT